MATNRVSASARAATTHAAVPAAAPEAFSVQGKVFDAGTRQGIGNLLVTIYDIEAAAGRAANAPLASLLKSAKRVGSVVTDEAGLFGFSYTAEEIAAIGPQRKRLNLLLVVSAPDDEASASAEKVFYYSNPPRLNAGRVETFNVGITGETQKKFGLGGEAALRESVGAYARLRGDEKALAEGVAEFHRAAIERDVAEKGALRSELMKVLATKAAAVAVTGEHVAEGASIRDKVSAVAGKAVGVAQKLVDQHRGVRVNLYLTPEDRRRLAPFLNNPVEGFATIPEHALHDILFRTDSSENPGTLLVHRNPIASFCAPESFEEKCAKLHTGLAEEGGGHGHGEGEGSGEAGSSGGGGGTAGTGFEAMTDEEIRRRVTRLLDATPSPDRVLDPAFNDQRADRATVENAVDAFSLRKGPAEVPAFYDFLSLQIAFEHVWKTLIDEQIVDASHTLQKKYKMKTGLALGDAFSPDWPLLVSGGNFYGTLSQEVPAAVAAQFDITLEEWADLSPSHQQKLTALANAIATACDPVKVIGGILGERLRVPPGWEKRRQDLREQGERLIDAVRHDDYYTLHKTLRDLHERINSNYEFTVFAADRNFHSVNFGLLNTWRLQMAPLVYQAGRLVKTIPLSPKEERKYSMKISRNLKVARKEAQKNNSSLKTEQTSTSRVEAEIMQKAQQKTNFSLATEGSYNIGISKGKSTTTFGTEAQQETAESRKDLREAVFKAAQDYSEERSVQIDTEETTASEYTESGMIVNPNDELSVTYLFYELQRRYRVSEQLYRVVPVVLVAQEVPAPHQITEAWVISNDWIINRHLLDDSFRPALTYLANKSVGDDFALRELRKNLRQQRNLVETLKTEFATASSAAENKYLALLAKIDARIAEEARDRDEGFFTNVGAFFGYDDADPESAKARELAASDEHQHAVEKAEKLAASLRQEVNNIHTLTREYNNTLRDHLDNEARVKRLLVHIRNNIFYYMQAIWSMEPPDQRLLRLHKVEVPQLDLARVPDPANPGGTVADRSYRVEVRALDDIFERFREPGTTKHRAFMTAKVEPVTGFRPLVEVADLDALLGFKGNYAIFPMKEHNALTQFMAAPYVDSAFGAMDPDELSNVNLSDYGKYVCCLHEKLPPADFDALKPQLKKWLELLLADPLRNGDEVIVPTESLFIEVLAGTHPLLENFKLRHRELDVYKAQADVRKAELENLRFASRLVHDERGDPDVDKQIVVRGALPPHIDVDNP